jgi:nitric oxide dioxygenase
VKQLATKLNLIHHTWYNQDHDPEESVHHGLMDLSTITTLPLEDGDFYLCGPVGFMQFAKQQLQNLGVDSDRIHYEVFGPHQDF